MTATVQIAELGRYLDTFAELRQRTSKQPEWLGSLRENAFGRFCDAGFPTSKNEDWRFTSVAPIAQTAFELPSAEHHPLAPRDIEPFTLAGAAGRIVFVDGVYRPELSSTGSFPAGVEAGALARVIATAPEKVEAHLGRYADPSGDAFCNLNTALFEDGGLVRIARGAVIEAPIHLLFVSTSTAGDAPAMVHPRTLIIVERNAQAAIVEEHVSLSDGVVFSNVVTELIAEENSVVSHHMIERENRKSFHISTVKIQQDRDSSVRSHSVLIGGALVRNTVHPVLAGAGGECLINGLFIGDDRQHMDNYMLVDHASPHCASHQFYNGILNGHAHGVFHGRILVQKDAQRTDAKQTNRNILLSDDAQVDTKPQLEIYADDVKCTHAATIGQIDENALFYLRTRGLEESAARELLLLAFAGECLERIQTRPARTYIERMVRHALLEVAVPETVEQAKQRWEDMA